jgi:hypothetical protein
MKKNAFWRRNKCRLAVGAIIGVAAVSLFFIIWQCHTEVLHFLSYFPILLSFVLLIGLLFCFYFLFSAVFQLLVFKLLFVSLQLLNIILKFSISVNRAIIDSYVSFTLLCESINEFAAVLWLCWISLECKSEPIYEAIRVSKIHTIWVSFTVFCWIILFFNG